MTTTIANPELTPKEEILRRIEGLKNGMAQAGVDLYAISKLLGHNEISTTQRYAHHCPESLRSSVEILENCYNFTTFGVSIVEGVKEGAI